MGLRYTPLSSKCTLPRSGCCLLARTADYCSLPPLVVGSCRSHGHPVKELNEEQLSVLNN
jgi:hypothetical protein